MTRKRYRVDFEALKRQPFDTIAAAWGYVRDTEASTPANPVPPRPGKAEARHQAPRQRALAYFNTLDADDNGTIIDFMLRQGLSFRDIGARFGQPARPDFRNLWSTATPGERAGLSHLARHPPGNARRLSPADPLR